MNQHEFSCITSSTNKIIVLNIKKRRPKFRFTSLNSFLDINDLHIIYHYGPIFHPTKYKSSPVFEPHDTILKLIDLLEKSLKVKLDVS